MDSLPPLPFCLFFPHFCLLSHTQQAEPTSRMAPDPAMLQRQSFLSRVSQRVGQELVEPPQQVWHSSQLKTALDSALLAAPPLPAVLPRRRSVRGRPHTRRHRKPQLPLPCPQPEPVGTGRIVRVSAIDVAGREVELGERPSMTCERGPTRTKGV